MNFFDLLSHPVISLIILLGVLVFIHELGHFLAARFFGIGVETFSIGFGPVLFSFKAFDTVFQLAAIPLGGFVKIVGVQEGEKIPEGYKGQEFSRTHPWKKLVVLGAGPAFNFFLAIFIYGAISFQGVPRLEPVLGLVKAESPAEIAGLETGDRVLSINGSEIRTWSDISAKISESPGREIRIDFERDSEKGEVLLIPETAQIQTHKGTEKNVGRIGIAPVFWLPIVTVLGKESKAYELGFRTGDQIKSYQVRSLSGELDSSGEISSWKSFLKLGELLKEKDVPFKVELNFLRPSLGEDKRSKISFELKDENFSRVGSFWKSFGFIESSLTIAEVPKAKKGLKKGDLLLSLEGQRILDVFTLESILKENKKELVQLEVLREGKFHEVSYFLKPVEVQLLTGKSIMHTLDVGFVGQTQSVGSFLERAPNVLSALQDGVNKTYEMSKMMLESLWSLVVGEMPLASLGGPISIAKVASDSARSGLLSFFFMMGLISINLGIVNLIPVPVLDGGRMIMVIFEWIKGAPLKLKTQENFYKVGFLLLLVLLILGTYNDVSRFWDSMLKNLLG